MSTKKIYTSRDLYRDFGHLSFGEVLRAFRQCDEISQIEFAKKLGVSPANLCDLERGRKIPSPLRSANIAKKLGLSKSFLVQVALQDLLRKHHLPFKISVAAR